MKIFESVKRESTKKKAEYFYKKALESFDDRDIKGPDQLATDMSSAVDKFFGTIGTPITSQDNLVFLGSIPTRDKAMRFYEEIATDIRIVFAEQASLEQGIVSGLNHLVGQRNAVRDSILDLRGWLDQATVDGIRRNGSVLRFRDDFTSERFIDQTTQDLTYDRADINTEAGVATLHLKERLDAIGDGSTITQFSSSEVQVISNTRLLPPTQHPVTYFTPVDQRNETYNGKMYGATPLAETASIGQTNLAGGPSLSNVVSAEDGLRLDPEPITRFLLTKFHRQNTLINEGLLKMIDNEAGGYIPRETIWETEMVLMETEANGPVIDFDGATAMNRDYTVVDYDVSDRAAEYHEWQGGTIEVRGSHQVLGADFAQRVRRPNLNKDELLSQIRSIFDQDIKLKHIQYVWSQIPKYRDENNTTISMLLRIKFDTPKEIGTITITPHSFHSLTPARIESIRIYDEDFIDEDGNIGDWVELPLDHSTSGLDGYLSENSSLLDRERSFISSNRVASQMEITFTQSNSYKQKYELMGVITPYGTRYAGEGLHIPFTDTMRDTLFLVDYQGWNTARVLERASQNQLNNSVDVISIAKSEPGRTLKSDIGAHMPMVELVKYVDDVLSVSWYTHLGARNKNTGDVELPTSGGRSSASYLTFRKLAAAIRYNPDSEFDYLPTRIGAGADTKLFTVSIPSHLSNRRRYAIGIRNLSITAERYSNFSEIKTVRWNANQPIGILTLKTVETIPAEFLTYAEKQGFSPSKAWITYEVSVDGGSEFHAISPINNPPLFRTNTKGQSYQVPTVIRINTDLPKERQVSFPWGERGFISSDNPTTVIMRIKLERPHPADGGSVFAPLTPKLFEYDLVAGPASAGGTP